MTVDPVVTVRIPGSKSLSQRALVCAALARGRSRITNVPDSRDALDLIGALKGLGFRLWRRGTQVIVAGSGGRIPRRSAEIRVGDSGANLRFVLPMLGLGRGEFFVGGSRQLLSRPIDPLLAVLNGLGIEVRRIKGGFAVRSAGVRGGPVRVPVGQTSQFLSGLLLAGPCFEKGLSLEMSGSAVSRPYVAMTLDVMRRFGIRVAPRGRGYRIPPGVYRSRDYTVEPDASGAAFLAVAAAVSGRSIRMEGVPREGVQGDWIFLEWLKRMGVRIRRERCGVRIDAAGPKGLRGIAVDLRDAPDLAPPLAAAALFARSPTRLRGIGHLRHKESDRAAVLAGEFARIGAKIEVAEDRMRIWPLGSGAAEAFLDPHQDHRMAMAFAVAACRIPGIRIRDPGCVAKSFPAFFDELAKIMENGVNAFVGSG